MRVPVSTTALLREYGDRFRAGEPKARGSMAELQVSAGAGAAVELRVGGLFGRSFGVFRRHVVSFCLLGGIAALPYLLPAPPGRLESPWAPWLVMLLAPVTQAVILYGTFQDMRGRPFGIGESFTRGLSRFFPIIG
jgi:hypothetical protein